MKRYQWNFKGFGKDGYKEYLKSKGLKLRYVTISKGGSVPIYSNISFVMHLRFEYKDGSVCCSFVMAKSRLAPIETLTMPRLELNAAVIGVKLFNLIIHEIDLLIAVV